MRADIAPGRRVLYRSAHATVIELIGHDRVLVSIDEGDAYIEVPSNELIPIVDGAHIMAHIDVAKITKEDWDVATVRLEAARRVMDCKVGRSKAVQLEAERLDMSTRQVWRLFKEHQVNPSIRHMIPRQPGRKKGIRVLDVGVERIIEELVRTFYLVDEKTSVKALVTRIATSCRESGLPPPTRKAVTVRLEAFNTEEHQRRRIGRKKAMYTYRGMPGHVIALRPLERVEIDHTPMDLIARSDDPLCDYVGRPWLTIAIDVCTRCVLGIHIGFDPPSALSVALCLTHAALPKGLEDRFGVPIEWPMHGVPVEIVVDNGSDFISEAFQRGCNDHGILLSYRPIGSPHCGGTIERLIGTMMGKCHLLPGTTKNSVKTKGDYKSEKHACMTLSEVRIWLVEQILGSYHVQEHRMLRMPPLDAWNRAVASA
jgi:putative transposase